MKKVNTKIQQDAATAVHGKNFTAYANKERSQINSRTLSPEELDKRKLNQRLQKKIKIRAEAHETD